TPTRLRCGATSPSSRARAMSKASPDARHVDRLAHEPVRARVGLVELAEPEALDARSRDDAHEPARALAAPARIALLAATCGRADRAVLLGLARDARRLHVG